jgi:hypothetical protein
MRSKDMLCMGLVNVSEQKKDGGHFYAFFSHHYFTGLDFRFFSA